MESVTNTFIGLFISTFANHLILVTVLGFTLTLGQNIFIGVVFTLISIARSYILRRLFNGRSAWEALKAKFKGTAK